MTKPDATAEQPAAALPPELQQLQSEAAALEAEAAPVEQGAEPAEAPVDYAEDARGLVTIAADALGAFYPSTAKVLDTGKRDKIAAALAPVMQKHGFTLAAFFGRWGEEIALGFALSQVAIPLAAAIRADRAAAAAEQGAKPAPPPAPTVTAATTPAPADAAGLFAKA